MALSSSLSLSLSLVSALGYQLSARIRLCAGAWSDGAAEPTAAAVPPDRTESGLRFQTREKDELSRQQ